MEHPETARRILAAAEQIFAARGMAGARTEEIAAAARVNKALLYYYFGDKRRLHRAVLEHLFGQLRRSIEAAQAPRATPRGRLRAFVNGYFDFVAGHPNYPRLVQRELMDSSQQLNWMVESYFRPLYRSLSRIIAEGIAAGDLRPVDPQQTGFTIIATTVSYFVAAPVLSRVLGGDALRPGAVAARRRAVFDFLEHGLFRSPGRPR